MVVWASLCGFTFQSCCSCSSTPQCLSSLPSTSSRISEEFSMCHEFNLFPQLFQQERKPVGEGGHDVHLPETLPGDGDHLVLWDPRLRPHLLQAQRQHLHPHRHSQYVPGEQAHCFLKHFDLSGCVGVHHLRLQEERDQGCARKVEPTVQHCEADVPADVKSVSIFQNSLFWSISKNSYHALILSGRWVCTWRKVGSNIDSSQLGRQDRGHQHHCKRQWSSCRHATLILHQFFSKVRFFMYVFPKVLPNIQLVIHYHQLPGMLSKLYGIQSD